MNRDDDDNPMVPRAFYVGDCSGVDITIPAVSGEDYLKQVHVEAKSIPQVMVAKLDMEKFNSKQTVRYDQSNGFIPAPPGLAPSVSVQREQVYKFSLLRKELFANIDKIKQLIVPIEPLNINDAMQWCRYCLGSEVCKMIYSKPYETGVAGTAKSELHNTVDGHEPLLSVVLSVSHPDVEKLLSHHTYWMERFGFSRLQGHWIFALLSVLQKPLSPDMCHLLRRLSRICAKLRAELENETDEQLFGLNYIICLIANYFDQKDMSDYSETEATPIEDMDVESVSSSSDDDDAD